MMNIKKICLSMPIIVGLYCLGATQPFAHANDNEEFSIEIENKAAKKYYGLFDSQEKAYTGLPQHLAKRERSSSSFPSAIAENTDRDGKAIFGNIPKKDYWLGQIAGHHMNTNDRRDKIIYFYDSGAAKFTKTEVKVIYEAKGREINSGSEYGLYSTENYALNAAMNPNKYADMGRVEKKTPVVDKKNIDFGFLNQKDYFMVEIAAPFDQNRMKVIKKFDSKKQTFVDLNNLTETRLGELKINLHTEKFASEQDLSGAEFAVYKTEETAKKGLVDNNTILLVVTNSEGEATKEFPFYSDQTFYVRQITQSKSNILSEQIIETKINKNKTSEIKFLTTQSDLIEPRIDLNYNNYSPLKSSKKSLAAPNHNIISREISELKKTDPPNALPENTQNIAKINTETPVNKNLEKEIILNREANSDSVNKTYLAATGIAKPIWHIFVGFSVLLVLTGFAMMFRKKYI